MNSNTTDHPAPSIMNHFGKGLKDGIPIALGYLSVSFTFGMMACSDGLPLSAAVAISATNVTSAGQFAGLALLMGGTTFFEMAMTQLVINLRYALMSVSLSQKLHKSITVLDRLLIAFCNTDEIFAVASMQKAELGRRYMFGLMLMPYLGWTLGTLLGGAAGMLLPETIRSALGIAIYGMFLAIIIPPVRGSRPVAIVVAVSAALSCVFYYVPIFRAHITTGFAIILCALLAAALGAILKPVAVADETAGEATRAVHPTRGKEASV